MSLYDDLGVDKSASEEEIKQAFRKKAMQTHPDKGGSVESFQVVQKAYAVLGDAEKKKHYDATGETEAGPDIETQAMHQLCTMFAQLVEKTDIAYNNPLEQIKGHIKNGQQEAVRMAKQLRREILKVRNALKRLRKNKGKHDFLAAVLNETIKQKQLQKQNLKHQIQLGRVMLKLLADYSYEVDVIKEPPLYSRGAWANRFQTGA